MLIKTETVLLGVIGHPVAQSKSPQMHNAALSIQKLPYAYFAFDVRPDELPQAVEGLRALGARGWNVTIPHKVAIMPLLDEISEEAQAIGAVNTVVHQDGKLIGMNTDGAGYVQSLREETGIDIQGQRVLILGAGGAARGVAYALAKAGAEHLVIANRTLERAQRLKAFLTQLTDVEAIALQDIGDWIRDDRTLIINTTSVGMYPDVDASPVEKAILPEGVIVSDLIYNPLQTQLLKEARQQGCIVHGGLGMFVHQGALAYERWTGVKPPLDVMRQAVTS